MYTLGYAFKPWTEGKAIADGPSILNYIRETARENDIDQHIRFRHSVKRLAWSSKDARWTIEAERDGEPVTSDGRLRFHLHRLLRLRRGLHAGVPRR